MIFSSGISALGRSIASAMRPGSQLRPCGGIFPLWHTAHLFWKRETTSPGTLSPAQAPTTETMRRQRIREKALFITVSFAGPTGSRPGRDLSSII